MARRAAYSGPNRRIARPSPVVVGLAVLAVAGIAFATLCPIELRPRMGDPDTERFAAFFVLGALIAQACGRRWLGATAAVMLLAFGFEAAQLAAPGRDPMLSDAIIKALGGVCGSAAAQAVFAVRRLTLSLSALLARRRNATRLLAS